MSGPKTPRIYRLLALVTIAVFIISPVTAMPWIPSAPVRSEELEVSEVALPIGTGSRDTDDLAASGLGGGLLDTDNPAGNGLPANALPLGNYTFAVNVTNVGTDAQNSFSVNNTIGYSASAIKVFNDSADGTGLGTWSKVNFTEARRYWALDAQNHPGSAGVNSFTPAYTSGPEIGKYGNWWEQVLEMKNCIDIPSSPAIEPHLTFWQMYTTQGSKDGGYAQMQIGTGAWMTITPENPVPPPPLAYPGSVNTAMSSGGGFSGTHTPFDGSGWNYTWFPLWSNQVGQVNGTCIKFRWWFASDGASTNNGWLIDDIRVQYGNGTADTLVAGFTPIVGNAGDMSLFNVINMNSPDENWTKVATQDHTGGNSGSFWTGDVFLNKYVAGEDSALISPVLDLTGSELARLSYWQRYNLSAGDGGWVEASTNGVTYNTIEPLFEQGTVTNDGTNYPSSIDLGSVYGATPAFSGNKDWTRVVFDLTPYVGSANAKVRFHLYANSDNQNDKGWYIDDVLVNKWHFTNPVTPYVNISVTTTLASGTKGTYSNTTKYVFDAEGYWMIKENAKLVGDTNASNNLYNGLIFMKDIRDVAVAPGTTGGVFLVNHGYSASFDLVVMNKGNLDDTFNITATSVPEGWNVSYIGDTLIDVSAFFTATVKSVILTNISSSLGDYKVNFSAKSKANISISAFYEVKITVTNKIPTGIILSTTTQVAVYQKVTFTAKDPDDQLDDSKGWEVYMWDFGDGLPLVNTSSRTTEYIYKKPTAVGTPFVVTLKVFDGLNYSVVTTQSKLNMTVTNANPTVNFTIEGTVVSKTYAINKNLTFKPRVSDENVTTCTYQWDFKDGTTMTNKTDVVHSFQNGGKYTVTLTVTDDSLAASSYTEQVVINTPPEAKIAAPSASHNGTNFKMGDSIYFSAAGSTDVDGDSLTYKWESNLAGILYEGPNVDFNYIFNSNIYVHTHQITLTVKDNKAMPDIAPATVMAMVSLNIIAADQHLPELVPVTGMVEAHEPINGTVKPDTEFTFKIIYKDVDGDPAYAVYLVIEDSTQPIPRNITMNIAVDTPSGDDIVAGILYTVKVKSSEIPNSASVIHSYKFTAADKRDLLNFTSSKVFGNLRITKDKYFGNPKDDSVTATVTFIGSDTDVPLKMEELSDPAITAPVIDNAPASPVGLFAKVSVNTSFPAANWDKAVLQITWGKPKFKANVDNLTEAQIYLYELKGGQWVRVAGATKDADSWKLDLPRGDIPAEGKTYALYGKPKDIDINTTDDEDKPTSNIEVIAIVALLAMVGAVIGLVLLTRQRKKAEKDWKGQEGIDLDIDITTGKGVTGEVTTEGGVEKMTDEQVQAESIGDAVKVFRPGGGTGELPGQEKEEEPATTEESAGEAVQESAGGEGPVDTPPEPAPTETDGGSPPADEPPKEG